MKPNQKVAGHHNNSLVTVTPVGSFCLAGLHYFPLHPQLSKTTNYNILLQQKYIALCTPVRDSQQASHFQHSSCLISLYPVIQPPGIFNVLPSSSGGWSTAVAKILKTLNLKFENQWTQWFAFNMLRCFSLIHPYDNYCIIRLAIRVMTFNL